MILGLAASPVVAELGAGLVTSAPALPMLAVTGAVGGLVPGGGQAADLVDGQRDQRTGAIVEDDMAGTAWRHGVTVCAGRAPSVAGPPAAGPPGSCRPDGGGRQAAALTARNACASIDSVMCRYQA